MNCVGSATLSMLACLGKNDQVLVLLNSQMRRYDMQNTDRKKKEAMKGSFLW